METRLIEFDAHVDERGTLVALEELKEVPFPIRRVFYIYDVPLTAKRGGHVNTCHEFLVAVRGSLTVMADGKSFLLGETWQGLFIPAGVRVDLQDFSSDCILLVLASEHYDQLECTYRAVHKLESPAWVGA